ncbi:MAG: ATP-binding protein [Bryobacterales bacterium]|nr:ATP-binding protein [Bryobacterales bacterium]
MTERSGQASPELNLELASSLESVDFAEEKALEIAARCGMPEDELHRVGVAIREAMVNAVVHGNRYNRNKKVHFRVHVDPGAIAITIGDEGRGFNPDAVPDPHAEANVLAQSGRGIMLIRAFMDGYEVSNRPGGGAQIRMVKILPAEGGTG